MAKYGGTGKLNGVGYLQKMRLKPQSKKLSLFVI